MRSTNVLSHTEQYVHIVLPHNQAANCIVSLLSVLFSELLGETSSTLETPILTPGTRSYGSLKYSSKQSFFDFGKTNFQFFIIEPFYDLSDFCNVILKSAVYSLKNTVTKAFSQYIDCIVCRVQLYSHIRPQCISPSMPFVST